MADMRDLQSAISDTEDFVVKAQSTSDPHEAIVFGLLAITRAVQEVGTRIDFTLRDVQSRSYDPRPGH
jgi:hypothetical protein